MAWTAPTTVVGGTTITASWGNTYVRDNTAALRASPTNSCSAFHNTTQQLSAPGVLNLNSEDWDTASMHDNATNNSRVTIPSGGGGRYNIFGYVPASSGAGGSIALRLDGTTELRASPTIPFITVLGISLNAGQYVELYVYSVAGTTDFGSTTAKFSTRLEVQGPLPPS